MNYMTNANYINVIITIAIFALMILLTYFAFIYSEYLVKMIGKKHIIVISKIMGIILGIIGVNMLIQGIKLAFKI